MLFLTEDNDFVGTDKNISFDEVQELSAGFGTWESEMKSEREQERERERMDELLFDLVHNHLRPGEGRIVFVSGENCVCSAK